MGTVIKRSTGQERHITEVGKVTETDIEQKKIGNNLSRKFSEKRGKKQKNEKSKPKDVK